MSTRVEPDLPAQDEARKARTKRQRRCWYFITVYACVLCGHEEVYRERRYGRRPEAWDKRHEYHEGACGDHFL